MVKGGEAWHWTGNFTGHKSKSVGQTNPESITGKVQRQDNPSPGEGSLSNYRSGWSPSLLSVRVAVVTWILGWALNMQFSLFHFFEMAF